MSLEQQIEHQRVVVEECAVVSTASPILMTGAVATITREQEYLDLLIQRRDQRVAAIAAHRAAEDAYADELVQLCIELEDARRELAATVTTAIGALTAVWDTAEAFDALLADRAAGLIAAGLPARYAEDTDEEVRWDTGGFRPSGRYPRLVLAGGEWHLVGGRQVATYALDAAIAGRQYVHANRTSTLNALLDPVTTRPEPVAYQPTPVVQRATPDVTEPAKRR